MITAFHHTIEPQLQAIAKQHTGFAINNIVKEVLSDMEYKSDDLLRVERNSANQITSVEYDSAKLNALLYSALNTIDESLLAAQDGKKDPTLKRSFMKMESYMKYQSVILRKLICFMIKGRRLRYV